LPLSDIDEARALIRKIEKKRLYQACRSYLPSLVLQRAPNLYKQLMSELMETYGKDLGKGVEERLRLLPSIPAFAEMARRTKKDQAAKRRDRRLIKKEIWR